MYQLCAIRGEILEAAGPQTTKPKARPYGRAYPFFLFSSFKTTMQPNGRTLLIANLI